MAASGFRGLAGVVLPVERAELGAVAQGGGVAEPENPSKGKRVTTGGVDLVEDAIDAQGVGGEAAQLPEGGLDEAAGDGFPAAGGALVDQQVWVGGGGPAGASDIEPCAHWTADLAARLAEHAGGQGARLLQVIQQAGIGWTLASTWPGTRARERALKREGGAARRCPLCGVQPRPVDAGRAA